MIPSRFQGIYAPMVTPFEADGSINLTVLAAAERACGLTSMITAHFAAEAQPEPLPPRPLLEAGGNFVLRWREWLARQD